MELEPADAGLDQLAGFADRELALVRVDAAERDQDVGVGARGLEDLVVAQAFAAHAGLVIDGEDDREHVPLAVVVGDLLRAGLRRAAPEVARRRIQDLGRDRILRL